MFESILCQITEYDPDVFESLIELAVEIGREGREGKRVGHTIYARGRDCRTREIKIVDFGPIVGPP
jgi:hypothetical protein